MFEQKVLKGSEFPVEQKNRKSTDVICTFIGTAFALTLFILACVFWNRQNFENKFFNLRKNGLGEACNDKNLLFNDINDLSKSTCVKDCPAGFSQFDGYCIPDNEDKRAEYLSNPEISSPLQYTQVKWTIFYTFIASLGLGFMWLIIVQCLPRLASILAHVLTSVILITFGVLALVLKDYFWSELLWLKIVVSSFCFVLAIISIIMLCIYANQIKIQGLFLDYSSKFISTNPLTILYLPFYIILMFGLIALTVWQHCCFSSKYANSRNFYNFNNSGVLQVLNVLEFIWASQFLRDSFNFCVSGNAVDFYWKDQKPSCGSSFKRLLCKHWGSVVGGSFLNGFFQIPTLIVQLLVCHPTACCSKMGVFCYNTCTCFTSFFDLVRTDSYSYINITGIPFCNAGRQCKKICDNSKIFVGYHSPIKHYKFISHVFLLTSLLIASLFIVKARLWEFGFWHITLLVVVIYVTITWFIGIHADSAQGLQTSYLCQHQLQPNYSQLQRIHKGYIEDLSQWEKHQKSDGNI